MAEPILDIVYRPTRRQIFVALWRIMWQAWWFKLWQIGGAILFFAPIFLMIYGTMNNNAEIKSLYWLMMGLSFVGMIAGASPWLIVHVTAGLMEMNYVKAKESRLLLFETHLDLFSNLRQVRINLSQQTWYRDLRSAILMRDQNNRQHMLIVSALSQSQQETLREHINSQTK